MAEVHKALLHILRSTSAPGGSDSKKAEEDAHKEAEMDKRRRPVANTTSIATSEGKSSNGSRVTSALLLNPRKVKVCFSDGKEQIMDLKLAIRQGYVKETIV